MCLSKVFVFVADLDLVEVDEEDLVWSEERVRDVVYLRLPLLLQFSQVLTQTNTIVYQVRWGAITLCITVGAVRIYVLKPRCIALYTTCISFTYCCRCNYIYMTNNIQKNVRKTLEKR